MPTQCTAVWPDGKIIFPIFGHFKIDILHYYFCQSRLKLWSTAKTLNPLLPKLFFILPRWRSSSNLVTVNFGRQIFSNHTIAKNFFYFETLDDVWLAVGLSVDRSASQINASKDVSFFGKEFRKFLLPPLRIWTLGILLISTLDQGFLIPAQDSHTLYMCIMPLKEACVLGSGCGSVGRVVAPDIRGPWIESRYW